ncbi:uncharacterized protein PG986_010546 [Apiospora aurea]|uniref:Uncharacterized protein n=1 Tax=Apiospora aurea TaxID=335848 RepID=A0ABR1Q2N4_9PEZI
MPPLMELQSESLRYGEAHRTGWPFPQADAIDTLEKYQPLLHSWENLAECIRHWVGVVWHSDGVLDTIRVTPCRGELDTDDDNEIAVGDDAESQAAEIPRADWIRQLILHIPAFDARRHRAEPYMILPRGLTVNLASGKELSFGETDKGYNMRPLTASRDEAVIIGLSCQYGLVYGHERAVSYSVVDAVRPTDNHDKDDEGEGNVDNVYQEEPQDDNPELAHEHLARYLWKSDYKVLLGGVRIWDVPGLHFAFPVRNVFTWSSEPDNPQSIALEALVWDASPAQSGRFRRLSAWTPQGSPLIHTIKVDSAPADVETEVPFPVCQTIGMPEPVGAGGKWHTFDINNAAGEFITEVAICEGARHPCRAVRITSNFKEVVWGWPDGNFNRFIRAPAGERLVGLVGVFGKPGWQHVQKGLNALAGLSMAI